MSKNIIYLPILSFFIASCSLNPINNNEHKDNFLIKQNSNLSTKALNEHIKSFSYSSSLGPKPGKEYMEFKPDSTPELNMVTNLELKKRFMGGIEFPKRSLENSGFSTKTCCGTGSLHWGARIANISSPTNNQWGAYAGHKVNLGQTFPSNDTLVYSPTMMPPNYTPLEVTTIYYRPPGSTTTQRIFGIWDHTRSSNQWRVYKDMNDSTWQAKYIGNFTDGQFYFAEILKIDGSTKKFTVKLYNYQNSTWEDQSPLPEVFGANVTAQSTGWDFHEPKFDDICPLMSPIKVSGLQVWNGSTWYNNDTAHGSSLISGSSTCPNWNKVMINDHYNWTLN